MSTLSPSRILGFGIVMRNFDSRGNEDEHSQGKDIEELGFRPKLGFPGAIFVAGKFTLLFRLTVIA